jgi:hypothetical protein
MPRAPIKQVDPLLYRKSEVPCALRCGPQKVQEFINNGELEVVQIGSVQHVTVESVRALIEKYKQPARRGDPLATAPAPSS